MDKKETGGKWQRANMIEGGRWVGGVERNGPGGGEWSEVGRVWQGAKLIAVKSHFDR